MLNGFDNTEIEPVMRDMSMYSYRMDILKEYKGELRHGV